MYKIAVLLAVLAVFASGAVGCQRAKHVVRVAPGQQPGNPEAEALVEQIRLQRAELARIRADIKAIEVQIDEVHEEISSIQRLPGCARSDGKPSKCSTAALEGIRMDLEDELAELHEQLRIEGQRLDELLAALMQIND